MTNAFLIGKALWGRKSARRKQSKSRISRDAKRRAWRVSARATATAVRGWKGSATAAVRHPGWGQGSDKLIPNERFRSQCIGPPIAGFRCDAWLDINSVLMCGRHETLEARR